MAIIISFHCCKKQQFKQLPGRNLAICPADAISCQPQNYKKILNYANISCKKGLKNAVRAFL